MMINVIRIAMNTNARMKLFQWESGVATSVFSQGLFLIRSWPISSALCVLFSFSLSCSFLWMLKLHKVIYLPTFQPYYICCYIWSILTVLLISLLFNKNEKDVPTLVIGFDLYFHYLSECLRAACRCLRVPICVCGTARYQLVFSVLKSTCGTCIFLSYLVIL